MNKWKNGFYTIVEEDSENYVSVFKIYNGVINVSNIFPQSLKQRDKIVLMLNDEVATINFEDNDIEVEMTDEGLEQAMLDIMGIYLSSHASDDIILQMHDSIIDDYEDNGEMDRYEFERWVNLVLRDSRVSKKKHMIERASKGLWF